MHTEKIKPEKIEERSFEIIAEILGDKSFNPEHESIIKRVIHTTADFDYAETLVFSENVVGIIKKALSEGAHIVTDTNMAKSGINEDRLKKFGGNIHCFMKDEDVFIKAKDMNMTRAAVSMEKAACLDMPVLFAIGNAPTALIRLCEMINNGEIHPVAVIGAPVGFVNVLESKRLLLQTDVPYIAANGRKGGSAVAAAICNAILLSL